MATNIPNKAGQILLAVICSAICALLISIHIYFLGVVVIMSIFGLLILVRPLYLICFLLFCTSFLDFFLPSLYFFSGPLAINFAGLRNIFLIFWGSIVVAAHFEKVNKAAFFFPISIYLFILTISTMFNFSNANLRFYTHVLSPFLFYFLIITLVKSKSDIKKVFAAILLSSIIPIIIAFLQKMRIVPSSSEGFTYVNGLRIESTLGHPNAFGVYLVLFAFYSVFVFTKLKNSFQKFCLIIYSLMAYACILMSQSRNALIGIAIGFFVIAKIRLGLVRAIIVSSSIIFCVLCIPSVNQRIIMPSTKFKTTLSDTVLKFDYKKLDEYSMGRLSIWTNWLGKMKKANFVEYLLGFGESVSDIKRYDDFHNSVIRTLVVNGLLTLIAFIYLIFAILFRLLKWLLDSYKNKISSIYFICAFSYALAITIMANFGKMLGQWQLLLYYFAIIALAERARILEGCNNEKY